MATKLPTPAELEALLNSPKVLELQIGTESAADRDAILATVPADVQAAAKHILLTRVVDEYFEIDGSSAAEIDAASPRPLAYYMATCDEKVPDAEEELRNITDTWNLDYYELDGMCFCDFCGWPGDNAMGAGVFWYRDAPGELTEVCVNNDDCHESNFDEYGDAVVKFNAWRRGEEYTPDD